MGGGSRADVALSRLLHAKREVDGVEITPVGSYIVEAQARGKKRPYNLL